MAMKIFPAVFISLVFALSVAAGEIRGRTVDHNGRGVASVRITAWNSATEQTQAIAFTNTFGYYRVEVPGCGLTYLVYADSRRYMFDPQLAFFLGDDDGVIELIFTAH